MNDKIVLGGSLKLKKVINGMPQGAIKVTGKGGGMTNAVKEALLDCFEHVAWVDDDGQVYYQALYDALYAKELVSISASFEQGQAVIYDDDTLDDLKQYLTVTANYDDGTSAVVTTYTLSGTLNPGTSSIQVSYENKKAYFNVTVTHRPGVLTVTNTLNGCTTSNSATSLTEGDPYTATITADSHYTLTGASVSITMGGVDITSSAYTNGTISIAEVTGSLVITITAVAVTLVSISAVYTQSGTVYTTDTLDSLKTDLVVTAVYSDSSTATVPSTDYTLSGTLTEGTSTITVSYGGKTITFSVTVSESYIVVTQGNDFVANPSQVSNRCSVRVYNRRVAPQSTLSVGCVSGYSVYRYAIIADSSASDSGTLNQSETDLATKVTYDNGDYIDNTSIRGMVSPSQGLSRSWVNAGETTLANSWSVNAINVGVIGFIIKKNDNSDITPQEAFNAIVVTGHTPLESI